MKESSKIKIEIVDYLGKVQRKVVQDEFGTGNFNQKIDASFLSSGLYFLKIQNNTKAEYYKFTKVD